MNVCALCTAVIEENITEEWIFLKKLTLPILPTFLLRGTETDNVRNAKRQCPQRNEQVYLYVRMV